MTYSRLNIDFRCVLLLSLLLLFSQSCHRGHGPEEGKQGDGAQRELLTPARMDELDSEEISLEEFLQPIETETYYLGTCESVLPGDTIRKEFIFSLGEVQKKSFVATLYDVTEGRQTTTTPMPLNGAMRAHKLVVTYNGVETTMKKIRVARTANGIQGGFIVDKRLYGFSLERFEQPEYKEFEKRYEKELYACKILKNVKYGSAMGYWTSNVTEDANYLEIFAKGVSESAKKKKLDLLMDVYLPVNDHKEARPLILLIHGGAFYVGDKADSPIVLWCKHFAACGYVVASINYRMGFQLTKASIERCGYAALQDAHAAVRFLLSQKGKYGIDPDYVFVAGSSAGAITSLNLAFMRNATRPASSRKHGTYTDLGDIEASGNTLQQDFRIRAVANMWGAVNDLALLNAAKTDIVSFHGDADRLVPYDSGIPFSDMKVKIGGLFFNTMYGSAAIHRKAQQLGYRSELHTFHGAGHAPHVDKENQPTKEFYYIQEHVTDFFYHVFVPETVAVRRVSGEPQWFRLEGEGVGQICWKAQGGFILRTAEDRARVVFVAGRPHSLRASVKFENGASKVYNVDL